MTRNVQNSVPSIAAIGILAIVGLPLPATPSAWAQEYTVTDLGTLGGTWSRAYGVNNLGQVVGQARTSDGNYRAFLWQGGVMLGLGTFGGTTSEARDINDAAQVVGWAATATEKHHAFLWHNGVMTDLGTLGGDTSDAYSINDCGQVAGGAKNGAGNYDAFLYSGGSMIDLGTLGGSGSCAYGLNNDLYVVGWAATTNPWYASHAFVWHDGVMTDIGGFQSEADSINESAQAVGYKLYTYYNAQAFLWDGEFHWLGMLPPNDTGSWASGINEIGQVVGLSGGPGWQRAFIYDSAHGMRDLNDLIPTGTGWYLNLAYDINDLGQIVGYGTIGSEQHAFLLTPVGACCYPNGSCAVTAQTDCTGAWQGAGTSCDPNPCNQPPVARAGGVYVGNPGQEIQFDGSHSYDPDADAIAAYEWSWFEGDSWHAYDGPSAQHCYDSIGTYSVALRVRDARGAYSEIARTRAVVDDGQFFTPPYDAALIYEYKKPMGAAEANAKTKNGTGAMACWAKAWLVGGATAECGLGASFTSSQKGWAKVTAEFSSVGGKVDWASTKLWIINAGCYSQMYPVDLDALFDWDIWGQLALHYLSLLIGEMGPLWVELAEGTLFDAVSAWATISDAKELVHVLENEDSTEVYRIEGVLPVTTGYHANQIMFYLLAQADSFIWGGSAVREGRLNFINVQEDASPPDGQLIITAQCPIDLEVADPVGRTVSSTTCEVPGARYVKIDLDGDGERDVHIFMPDVPDGPYSVTVLPTRDADPLGAFSIRGSWEGRALCVTRLTLIENIPPASRTAYRGPRQRLWKLRWTSNPTPWT